jgi:hypothetical protein
MIRRPYYCPIKPKTVRLQILAQVIKTMSSKYGQKVNLINFDYEKKYSKEQLKAILNIIFK